jgi:hypothetical protein
MVGPFQEYRIRHTIKEMIVAFAFIPGKRAEIIPGLDGLIRDVSPPAIIRDAPDPSGRGCCRIKKTS